LSNSRPHAVVISGASEATAVQDVPAEFVDRVTLDSKASVCAIRNIEEIFECCAAEEQMLGESRMAPWTNHARPARKSLRGYRQFAGPTTSAASI
jgi:hypothetical protein